MLDPNPIVRLAALPVIAALMAACSSAPSEPAPEPPAPVAETSVEAPPRAPTRARPDAALERRVATLELQLLEKGAEVQYLQAQLDEARH